MAAPVLEVHDLIVRYGRNEIVNVPALNVNEREVLAIMGPNGAGKSTLLRVLAFLEAPNEGTVVFKGTSVEFSFNELLQLHRRTAVIFQEPLLLDTTVFENVALGLKLRGRKDRLHGVRDWLERFGIAHLSDRRAKSLSSGEAQRTNLARAFVVGPEVLFLDEPFATLDPPTKSTLITDFKDILAEARTTTVFVTHDQFEAMTLGDRVAVMMSGRIPQLDSPNGVFSSPLDDEIARFVGFENTLSGYVSGVEKGLATVEVSGAEIVVNGDAEPGERVLVCVRPEDIRLSKDGPGATVEKNCFQARVTRAIPLGLYYRVVLDFGNSIVALVTTQRFRELNLQKDQQVNASFLDSAAHLIKKARSSRPPGAVRTGDKLPGARGE